MLPNLPLGYPPFAITPDKVEIYPEKKRRSRGYFPWVASLPGGREEVILQTAAENKRI
jgi:hypothetical protein